MSKPTPRCGFPGCPRRGAFSFRAGDGLGGGNPPLGPPPLLTASKFVTSGPTLSVRVPPRGPRSVRISGTETEAHVVADERLDEQLTCRFPRSGLDVAAQAIAQAVGLSVGDIAADQDIARPHL